MKVEFDIFEPSIRHYFSYTKIVYTGVLSSLLILFLFDYFSILPEDSFWNLVYVLSTVFFFLPFLAQFVIWNLEERMNGNIQGKISIENEIVTIKNNRLDLNNVESLDFDLKWYKGELEHHYTLHFGPWRKNGTQNWLNINYNNGQKSSIQFIRKYANQEKYLKMFLIKCLNENKISHLRVCEILNIEDYDKIQDFKKEIKLANN